VSQRIFGKGAIGSEHWLNGVQQCADTGSGGDHAGAYQDDGDHLEKSHYWRLAEYNGLEGAL
jgi:hypothetical protein